MTARADERRPDGSGQQPGPTADTATSTHGSGGRTRQSAGGDPTRRSPTEGADIATGLVVGGVTALLVGTVPLLFGAGPRTAAALATCGGYLVALLVVVWR